MTITFNLDDIAFVLAWIIIVGVILRLVLLGIDDGFAHVWKWIMVVSCFTWPAALLLAFVVLFN